MEAISRKKEVVKVIEIKKQLRGFMQTYGGVNWAPTITDYPDNYRGIGANPTFWVLEEEIDINGLTTHMEKALQVSHIDVHQSPRYSVGFGIAAGQPFNSLATLTEILIVTDTPFSVTKWRSGLNTNFLPYRIPGVFSDALPATVETLSTDEILFGRFRTYTNDNTAPADISRIVAESYFGDAKVTMSDRLYVYRILNFLGAPTAGEQIAAPELEIVINGHKGELSDLEQIMELRRSYLLQQDIA